MAETDDALRPATVEEPAETLAFALWFNGRKKARAGDEFMARITAERLTEHLGRSGFVILKQPAAARHRAD